MNNEHLYNWLKLTVDFQHDGDFTGAHVISGIADILTRVLTAHIR